MLSPSPTPWVAAGASDIRGADNSLIGMVNPLGGFRELSAANRDLIIAAVNERGVMLEALRRLALARHVRMTYGGGEAPSGGSCKLCRSEWAETSSEFHSNECLLAGSSQS